MNFRRNGNTCHRKTIAHSFCHGINICVYTAMIMTIKFTRSSITTLYRIRNVHGIVCITQTSYFLQESICCYINTTNTLNTFNDNSANIILLKCFFQCCFIIKRKKDHIVGLIYRCHNRWIVCNCYCKGSSAMKGFSKCNDLFSAIIKRSKFQRILIGFCT